MSHVTVLYKQIISYKYIEKTQPSYILLKKITNNLLSDTKIINEGRNQKKSTTKVAGKEELCFKGPTLNKKVHGVETLT